MQEIDSLLGIKSPRIQMNSAREQRVSSSPRQKSSRASPERSSFSSREKDISNSKKPFNF